MREKLARLTPEDILPRAHTIVLPKKAKDSLMDDRTPKKAKPRAVSKHKPKQKESSCIIS